MRKKKMNKPTLDEPAIFVAIFYCTNLILISKNYPHIVIKK